MQKALISADSPPRVLISFAFRLNPFSPFQDAQARCLGSLLRALSGNHWKQERSEGSGTGTDGRVGCPGPLKDLEEPLSQEAHKG